MSFENRVVALLPQKECVEDGVQLSPPGFNAIVLPYADEVREPKTTEESLCDVKPSQGICNVGFPDILFVIDVCLLIRHVVGHKWSTSC